MMLARVITPPAPFVSWDRAKQHLRLDSDEEKALVEVYLAAAMGWIDGPAGWLGRSVGDQVIELTAHDFPCDPLPFGPVVSIVSVKYDDEAGQEATVSSDDYRLRSDGAIETVTAWPSVEPGAEAVRIRYRAGYPVIETPAEVEGDDPVQTPTVPMPIVQAVLLLVGQWYRTRAAVNVGNIVSEMPFAVDALLLPYRIWR